METAFARTEQLLGIRFAVGDGRNWRAPGQPALCRTRPERLHDTSSTFIFLFCNRWDIFISWEQMGALCHVPALFLRFHDPIAGGRGGFSGKRIEGSFGRGCE